MNRAYMPPAQRDDWGTPPSVLALALEWINSFRHPELGAPKFDRWAFDLAADAINTVAPLYFDKKADALTPRKVWADIRGPIWCNPPYGRDLYRWVEKAHRSSEQGCDSICMLLPARTDTKWFHEFVDPFDARVKFLPGRIKFVGAKWAAPFPTMLCRFGF